VSQLKVAGQSKDDALENPIEQDVNVLRRSALQLRSALAKHKFKAVANALYMRSTSLFRRSECRKGGRTGVEPTGKVTYSAVDLVKALSLHMN
jgi:hypothetical protein